MDNIDLRILTLLQANASLTVADIGKRVGLTAAPCWKRIQKLEETGVIRGRVALLDPKKLNVGLTVFVTMKTNRHDDNWLKDFATAVKEMPEVIEFHRLAGDIDYLLRVVVPDMEAYDEFYKGLIEKISLSDVTSSFSMEQIKYTTALPLNQT